ncbi:hypothetical protein T484DRAFT_1764968 [Baffinella frigidus]|nr:hypothetical protein T484DRAFT_1764968 [Cryptophyta sp. CCMP2293]
MRLLLPLVGLALPLLSVAFMVPQLGGLARGSRQRLAATPHPASSPRVYARAGRRQVSLPGLAMSTVRQVALEEDLMGVVAAAAQPLPNRPDGTVVVVLYSSEQDYGCMATDQEFENSGARP